MAEPVTTRFGPLLRRYRLAAGLSQEALAERAGLSARGISLLEAGHRTSPRPETVRLLADALGLEGAARAELIGAARPESAVPAPPAAGSPMAPPPLPAPPTRLVGREREVAAVCAWLRRATRTGDGARLLSLTGPGGVGKTRLALAAARELSGEFADGAAWVELAPLRDPALVAGAIASVLGVRDGTARALTAALTASLRPRQLLLVLDNCEHLPTVAALVAELLAACPLLVVLATSRERLRLRGERELAVGPLAVADERAGEAAVEAGLAGLAGVAAVRLFVVRAAEAQSGFALTPANAPTVVEICRRLDGLPLAIELAAARVKVLSPADLLRLLERRLPLLTGGPVDLPARQRTMRDAIAWSHDLLSPEERALFRGLAPFAGGLTLEAAEYVGDRGEGTGDRISSSLSPGASRPSPVLDLVAALVDKGLLRVQPGPNTPTRYGMLETIREYAAERLAESADADAARAAHAAYFLALAERERVVPFLPASEAQLSCLEAEHANLLAALAYLAEGGEPAAARLVAALGWFWFVRGHLHVGRRWLEWALDRTEGVSTGIQVRTRVVLGLVLLAQGDLTRAEARALEGLAVARAAGDTLGATQALVVLGVVLTAAGETDRATSLLSDALALARSLAEPPLATAMESVVLANLGAAVHAQGRLAEAAANYEAALVGYRSVGARRGELLAVIDLADVARDLGDRAAATERYREGLRLAWAYGEQRAIADVLEGLGSVAAAAGRALAAARLFGAADGLRERAGIPNRMPVNGAAYERAVAAARTAGGEAPFAAAWEAGRALPFEQAVAEALAETDEPLELDR